MSCRRYRIYLGILSFSRTMQEYILQLILWLSLRKTILRLWNGLPVHLISIQLSTVGSA